MTELAKRKGVRGAEIHNCLYGGFRRKWTKFMSNLDMSGHFCQTCVDENSATEMAGRTSASPPVSATRGEIIDFKSSLRRSTLPVGGRNCGVHRLRVQEGNRRRSRSPISSRLHGGVLGPQGPIDLTTSMQKGSVPRTMGVSGGDTHPGTPSGGRG